MSKLLLTITGPSGSGKTSIVRILEKTYGVPRIITCTTRPPRKKEKDGVDYHFITDEVLEKHAKARDLIALARFDDHSYATIKQDIYDAFKDNDVAVIIVEPDGAQQFKAWSSLVSDIDVRNVYVKIDPKRALAHMAHRDGWSKARNRQKADREKGLYYDKTYLMIRQYDCVISNDRTNSIDNMAYDVMNYIEAWRCSKEMKEERSEWSESA